MNYKKSDNEGERLNESIDYIGKNLNKLITGTGDVIDLSLDLLGHKLEFIPLVGEKIAILLDKSGDIIYIALDEAGNFIEKKIDKIGDDAELFANLDILEPTSALGLLV